MTAVIWKIVLLSIAGIGALALMGLYPGVPAVLIALWVLVTFANGSSRNKG